MNNATTTTKAGTNNLQVAETIIEQINRSDFWARARWGVKQIFGDAGSSDSLPGVLMNCNKKIKIMVKLAADDTYSIEIGRLRGFDYSKKFEIDGVYADSLVQVIDRAFSGAFGSL